MTAVSLQASTMQAISDVPGLSEQDHIDLGASFPSVGRIDGDFSGSAVLIAPNWVLTAAHVADFSDNDEMVFTLGGNVVNSAEIFLHPDYSTFASDHADDIALVRLESAIGDITPATLWGFDNATDVLERNSSWIGFGKGGDGLTGSTGEFGKRGFTNIIEYTGDEIGVTPGAFVTDFDRVDGSENLSPKSDPFPTALEGQVTPFDSGGGVFTDIAGLEYLIGVISFGGAVDGSIDSDYGDVSGAINLHGYLDWIESTSGVTAVPEPGHFAVLAGLLIGAGVAIQRRRERKS